MRHAVKSFSVVVEPKIAEGYLKNIRATLGDNFLKKYLFPVTIIKMEHTWPRKMISRLGRTLGCAGRYGNYDQIVDELRAKDRRGIEELIQRYEVLGIMGIFLPPIIRAQPEPKLYQESNPDWLLDLENGESCVFEVTQIGYNNIDRQSNLINNIPWNKIQLNARHVRINFKEVVTDKAVQNLRRLLEESVKKTLPYVVEDTDFHLTITAGDARPNPQISFPAKFADLVERVNKKKKQNQLHKLQNVYIGIYVPLLNDVLRGENLQKLQDRIRKSAWLKGVLLIETENEPTRYVLID